MTKGYAYVYNPSHSNIGENMQDILSFLQNHWMLTGALVIIFVLLLSVEFIRQRQGARRVSPVEATQLINRQDAVVVDLRPADVFNAGHIVGSISIPFVELENKFKKLEKFKNKPIILVCATGLESARATTELMKKGLPALILAGGIRGWREADMPLTKG
jgi:rhodanese-related sulfurtransferase